MYLPERIKHLVPLHINRYTVNEETAVFNCLTQTYPAHSTKTFIHTLAHTHTLDLLFKNSVLFQFCLRCGLKAAQCIDLSHSFHFIEKTQQRILQTNLVPP